MFLIGLIEAQRRIVNKIIMNCWRFSLKDPIILNSINLKEKIIMQPGFEFMWYCKLGKLVIRKGVNCLRTNNKMKLVGGQWLVVVKFHESKLTMMVEEGTTVETVIQRIARWLAIGPEYIEFIGRLFPGNVKVSLTPDMIIIDERNKSNYVKVILNENPVNNIKWKEFEEDNIYMMAIQVGGTTYRINKYLMVKLFKRLLVNKFSDHWPEFYGSDDGICYDDWMIMKDIDCSLMVIWSIIAYKDYKIGIEGTAVLKITLNRNILIKEMLKTLRKNYELGKDVILTDMNSRKYDDNEKL
jgi:hypothetical protein